MPAILSSRPTRRRVIQQSFYGAAAVALCRLPLSAFGVDEDAGDQIIPFLEPQPIDPAKATLRWDELKDWITPMDQFFGVQHYGIPPGIAGKFSLEFTGLMGQPKSLTLDEIKKLPRKEITATLECSGNGASDKFMGAIGNATWAGTPLAPLLKGSDLSPEVIEIAFWGADQKSEKIRDNDYEQDFARALSLPDALNDNVILAYEMNGQPLTLGHGAPLRLIVPGWYGIAWVKWLNRIEARDHRLMNRFMARDYVTIRGETLPNGQTAWKESSVGPMNLKSIVAKVVRRRSGDVTIMGAAWSGLSPVKTVDVKIDDGQWIAAKIDDSHREPCTWRFWTLDWKAPPAGEHTLTSRAGDARGNLQPAASDPAIKLKKTYWEANQQWPRKIKT